MDTDTGGEKALLHTNRIIKKNSVDSLWIWAEMRLSLDRKIVNGPLVSACVLAAKYKILGVQNQLKK